MEYIDALKAWSEEQVPQLMTFLMSLFIALVILLLGHRIIKLLLKYVRKSMERSRMDEGVVKFLLSVLKAVCYVFLYIMAAMRIGLEASTVIAVVGSVGLAIGLSLQGSLSNFAGGVLLMTAKPFVLGDYIAVDDKEGTVKNIDIIYTTLLTADNRKIVLPNGKLANSDIINLTSEPIRRLDLTVPVDGRENIQKVREVLGCLLQKNEMIRKDQPLDILIQCYENNSVILEIRIWAETDQYWNLRVQLMDEIREVLAENGISLSYDRMQIEIIPAQDSK